MHPLTNAHAYGTKDLGAPGFEPDNLSLDPSIVLHPGGPPYGTKPVAILCALLGQPLQLEPFRSAYERQRTSGVLTCECKPDA